MSTKTLKTISLAAITTALLFSTPTHADELSRIMERNRGGFIVRMDEEDWGKIAHQLVKYECTSLFTGGTCTHHVGGGFEQSFTTTTTPPNPNAQPKVRGTMTQHVPTSGLGATIAQNIIVEALTRQYQDESRRMDYSTVNPEGERAMAHQGDDRSIMDIFLDPANQRTVQQVKDAKAHQANRIMDDKHDSDAHVVNKKRQRFVHYLFPDDPILAQRPSHSPTYLASLLGNYHRDKGHQYTPGNE